MLAVLNVDIKFDDNSTNETICIKKNSIIYVDSAQGVAFFDTYHFCIDKSEFSMLNQSLTASNLSPLAH
jgi:hypothetical protein